MEKRNLFILWHIELRKSNVKNFLTYFIFFLRKERKNVEISHYLLTVYQTLIGKIDLF